MLSPTRDRWPRFWRISVGAVLALTVVEVSLGAIAIPERAIAQTDAIQSAVNDLKDTRRHWIQIDLSEQLLTAWEGGIPVYSVLVSTGRAGERTPTGVFEIQSMHDTARMQGPNYDIPDVPFVMYYDGNYGIHGTYWHGQFGTPVSNGCTNVAVDHAEWLFQWSSIGTPVVVQE